MWIDRRDWAKPLSADDTIFLCNGFSAMAGAHFIPWHLWRETMRDELEHECKAAANAPSEPSPPPPPAPEAPPNVVPIKDTDFAPWHDISGAGGLQGEAPTYRPPGSFRCYGDHPGW